MAIKTFDDLQSLSEHFDHPVFKDTLDDTLIVYEQMVNTWHRYRWTPGHREIKFVESMSGELPIMVQVYPDY